MLCEANVSLSEWPQGQRRDVDPKDETIKGLLRAGYIVPVVPRGGAKAKAEKASE